MSDLWTAEKNIQSLDVEINPKKRNLTHRLELFIIIIMMWG